MGEPRIILLDIETLPSLTSVMRVFPQLSDYPGLTLKASVNSIICFGYKVFGESNVHCINAWDFKEWNKDVNNDFKIVKRISEILQDADAVVTHNGKRFDFKFIQTRLLHWGLKPIHKIPHIDTCQISKNHLLMFNNRLNTLSKFMTTEEKLENGGWDLWVKVMQRDKKAQELMAKYCKQDVVTLNAVFKKLLPLISNIPNYNLYRSHDNPCCSSCGSTRVQKKGTITTKSAIKQRFYCLDCGSWMSDNKKTGYSK